MEGKGRREERRSWRGGWERLGRYRRAVWTGKAFAESLV